jgi:HAMP domain-containing protein
MKLPRKSQIQWRLALAGLVLFPWLSGAAFAQSESERVRELERKLEKSMEAIEQLTRRVNELERGQPAAKPVAPAKAEAPEARIEALEKSVAQMASPHADHAESGVPVHGFADVSYEHSSSPRDVAHKSGFSIGNLDFFFTPNFDRIRMLAELNFEVNEAGALSTDLERLQLGYTFSDSLTAWMGRFHTPYGYWNAAFHHGAQIQTVTRPRFVDFEDKGGILPAHSVGIWGNGQVAMGPGKLRYDAYVANGSRIVDGIIDFNAHRDDNSNKALGGNIGYRFDGGALDGLLVGLHALKEDVSVYQGEALQARTQLNFTGGYFYFDSEPWEAIGEYYRFRNKDLSGGSGTHASWAAFLQVGHTFMDRWTPYYRWEKTSLDQADLYFAAQESGRSYTRHVLGIKYALNPNTALKFEANRTREILGEEKTYSEARAQFAVRF